MIITRAPFRITLGGGGTDLPSFYEKKGGFLVTMAIDKYIHVSINRMIIDPGIQLHYKNSEYVTHPSLLNHPFAREILLRYGITSNFEMASMADLPARSGMGSSGSYAVAAICSLKTYLRQPIEISQIAEEASDIEINVLKNPVGKQDQYIAAYGGIISMEIATDGSVKVEKINIDSGDIIDLIANMRVYYTGVLRDAGSILKEQNESTKSVDKREHREVMDSLLNIKEIGYKTREAIEKGNFDEIGKLFDEHWSFKKRLSNYISINQVDKIYTEVKEKFGVLGGKLIGAGGGGFLLFYAPKNHRMLDDYMKSMSMPKLSYFPDYEGVRVVLDVSKRN
jgi:D-glycero-alpha-D-manno-heptose-7-phosphate kinase